jgi:precorrin-3B synthase
METGDGWLVRLHPPGAKLTPAQLRRIAALAAEHGNGLVEISARANLQLRGVTPDSHPRLVERLLAEHLVDEHDGDGPQRVTLVSPLAGWAAGAATLQPSRRQAGEGGKPFIDALALADRIEAAARAISALPAKLCVIVDDGTQALDAFPCDIRLVGVDAERMALRLGEGPWLGPVAQAEAAATVEAILRGFARLRSAAPDHIRRLRDLSPASLAGLAGLPETTAPATRPIAGRAGLFAAAPDRFAALIGLPFGRCPAGTLDRLATGLETNAAEIRLSPWRGLAFRDLDRIEAERLLALADSLGLITRDDDPRLAVQACAGSPACARADAPAMTDAAVLAQAAAGLLAQGLTFHVSGCAKGCAHPAAADLTLVGRDGGYDVVTGGTARDKPTATLDLSALLTRLQPGQDIHARLKAARSTGSQG